MLLLRMTMKGSNITHLRVLQMSKHMTLSQKKAASRVRCLKKAGKKRQRTKNLITLERLWFRYGK